MARKSPAGLAAALLLTASGFVGFQTVGTPSAYAAAPTRPIVLVFPGTVNPTGGGVTERKDGDDQSPDARTRAGVLAFSFCLGDSGSVMAIRYDPKLSMVIRALHEARVTVAKPEDPTPAERLEIAKALGAVYLVAVSTLTPPDAAANTSTIEMSIDGTDVASHKSYTDHIRMSSGAVPMRNTNPTPEGDDSNTVRHFSGNDRLDNVLQSAANTLVLRMLGTPLRDYSRGAAPADLLPAPVKQTPTSPDVIRPTAPIPPATPVTTAPAPGTNPETPATTPVTTPDTPAAPTPTNRTPARHPRGAAPGESNPAADDASRVQHTTIVPTKIILPPVTGGSAIYDASGRAFANPDDEATQAIRQAAALLSDGDSNAAIMMLRQEIDRQPLSPALRIALAKTYIGANRGDDAESEARRALIVLPAIAPTAMADLTGVLMRSISSSQDSARARAVYTQIAKDLPNATWAHVALAGLDEAEGQNDEAETEYRAVLKAEPANVAAARGLAQLRISQGDLPGAQAILDGLGKGPDAVAARYEVIIAVFDAGTTSIAAHLTQNRAAWEAKTLSNDAIGNATNAQTNRLTSLITLLRSVTPAAAGRPEADILSYKRRIYAASLLVQAGTATLRLIQTGDADAGSEATLQLDQFQQALSQAQGK